VETGGGTRVESPEDCGGSWGGQAGGRGDEAGGWHSAALQTPVQRSEMPRENRSLIPLDSEESRAVADHV